MKKILAFLFTCLIVSACEKTDEDNNYFRISEIEYFDSVGALKEKVLFGHNDDGLLKSEQRTKYLTESSLVYSTAYEYDKDLLVTIKTSQDGDDFVESTKLSYDQNNRLKTKELNSQEHSKTTYSYNDSGQLTESATSGFEVNTKMSFHYDERGNLSMIKGKKHRTEAADSPEQEIQIDFAYSRNRVSRHDLSHDGKLIWRKSISYRNDKIDDIELDYDDDGSLDSRIEFTYKSTDKCKVSQHVRPVDEFYIANTFCVAK